MPGRLRRRSRRLACWFRRRGRELGRWRRPGDRAVLDDGRAADHLVVHVDVDVAILLLAQLFGKPQQVGGVERARLLGEAARQIGVADDAHALP